MGAEWLNSLEGIGGRLVPAARIFADSERPPMPGAGTNGVRWLVERIEGFVDRDTSEPEDDLFVEGAGAVLGLLLIEHLGGRARAHLGAHRVQLGRFGWFDPFEAIQDALDAENPRARLAEYLSLAELEATDSGPVSRVVRAFAETLESERPDLGIRSQFELTVDLDNGATVDLRRLEQVSRGQDDQATHEAARRIVSMLPGAGTPETTPWHEAAPRLLPRLVSRSFIESLPNEQQLHLQELGVEVHVALQLRYGSRARYVRSSEVAGWALGAAAAQRKAVENLAAKSRSLRLERVTDGVLRVRQGDGLDGARLLLPDLALRLEQLEKGPWIAASPHRDVLLVGHGTAVDRLAAHAEVSTQRAPHPVSASLFAVTAHGPRPLLR